MIERLEEEIQKQKRVLLIIAKTFEEIIHVYAGSENLSLIEKQLNLFNRYLEYQESRDVDKYNNKTNQNIKKINNNFLIRQKDMIISALENDQRKFRYDEIEIISSIFARTTNLSVVFRDLSNLYVSTLNKIVQNERNIEHEKKKSVENRNVSEDFKTIENESQNQNAVAEKIINNADVLLRGPKKRTFIEKMQGKDLDIDDMHYLYGLAMDILVLMEDNQYVKVRDIFSNDKVKIEVVDFPFVDKLTQKASLIYRKYGVSSLEGLLDKYESIRNVYYNNYAKLNSNQQQGYEINKFPLNGIKVSLENVSDYYFLYLALQNEKFKFPPSKQELMNLINRRILNGKNFEFVEPYPMENVSEAQPKSYEQYSNVFAYYRNLTKNMNISEIAKLYLRVMSDLDYRKTYMDCSDKVKEEYYVIIQKMFCELIMEKQGKKILDYKQYKEELMKIAQDVLNETVKFSVFNYNNVTKEEQEKRKQTIYAEYIKYLAFEQNKEKAMKFSEFAQVRYGFFNPNDLEEYYNQQIESERKSRK